MSYCSLTETGTMDLVWFFFIVEFDPELLVPLLENI